MTIHQLFENTAFSPERIALLVAAYEETLRRLDLVERDDPMTQTIAKKIMEVAERGVLDAEQISSIAIKELGL